MQRKLKRKKSKLETGLMLRLHSCFGLLGPHQLGMVVGPRGQSPLGRDVCWRGREVVYLAEISGYCQFMVYRNGITLTTVIFSPYIFRHL